MRTQDGIGLTGAGKGDADRSPGWRKNYDSIDWGKDHHGPKSFRKIYRLSWLKTCEKYAPGTGRSVLDS